MGTRLVLDLTELTIGEVSTMEQIAGFSLAAILEQVQAGQVTMGVLASVIWQSEHRVNPALTPADVLARPVMSVTDIELVTPDEAKDPTPAAG